MSPKSRWGLTNDLKIVINNVLGKVSWSLRRSPIVLLTLFCTLFRCKLKPSLVSKIIPRCLSVDDDLTKFSLKYNRGWSFSLIFLLKITSWACFLGSGLNLIFHWKSLFRSLTVEFRFWTTENRKEILDSKSSHQVSHWYRSKRMMVQE